MNGYIRQTKNFTDAVKKDMRVMNVTEEGTGEQVMEKVQPPKDQNVRQMQNFSSLSKFNSQEETPETFALR